MSRAMPDVERSLAFGSVGASFTDIGTPITRNYYLHWLQNLTDATVEFSWDGADNVNLTLAPNTALVLDEATNVALENAEPANVAIGTQYKARHTGVAPTEGSVKVNGEFIVL